ncbi:MAG: hypothetical protein EOO01_09730 [Chitinophagaceae bacterium]|nr:MAG: hypothetical protein EOO01_09730 [Chitinophagaceae bacterium]
MIDFIYGRKAHNINYTISDSELDVATYTKPARTLFRVEADSNFLFSALKKYPFGVSFLGKKILILSKLIETSGSGKSFQADYLLITGNSSLKLTDVLQNVKPSLVLFDATNSAGKIARWKRECELLHLRCFSIRDSGALVLSLHPDSLIAHRGK